MSRTDTLNVLNEGLLFEIKKQKYNKETLEAIEEAKQIKNNSKNYKSYNDIEKLMEDLNN